MTVNIRIGDCRKLLQAMPDESVDCIVTSPPYWGLRDYGVAGQIGMETTLAGHLQIMVEVFREARRVLKKGGTCWINYGDCYATSPNGRSAADTKAAGNDDRTFRDKPFSTIQGTMKPKDLCMIPNRLAIALQDDGWWVRSEIIWHKPNPMPESIKDRPACSHEKIWLLTKSDRPTYWRHRDTELWVTALPIPDYRWLDRLTNIELTEAPEGRWKEEMLQGGDSRRFYRFNLWSSFEYFYDADAVRRPLADASVSRLDQDIENQTGSFRQPGKTNGPMKAVATKKDKQSGHSRSHAGFNDRWDAMEKTDQCSSANLRNVWTIATAAFSEAHFATFPPALVEPCIKAGCPVGGTVLDPFGGAGTVGLVADRLKRHAILFELNPEYAAIAERRLQADCGMFIDLKIEHPPAMKPRCREVNKFDRGKK